MTIHVYDGMAVLRERFNTTGPNSGPRGVFSEMLDEDRSNVFIWCFEGKGSLNTRRALFPGYKVRPSSMTDGIMAMIQLTRDVLKHTRAIQVSVPGFEADDVIAHLAQVHGMGGDNMVIHTVDRDLHALATRNVTVTANPLKECTPDQVRLYKTLVGDPSDKIPGLKGFGQKAWEACNPRLLQAAMDGLIAGRPVAHQFVQAGMKGPTADRIVEPEVADQLRIFWQIIGFFPLPDGWDNQVIAGKPDRQAGDAMLREFFH